MLRSLFRKNPAHEAGEALYAAAAEQSRSPAFYLAFGAPDTVEGRFEMLALHAWLVMRRLKGDPRARAVSQKMFDAMFAGLDAALREMGVGDLVVGKKIRRLAENFYGRVGAYNEALGQDGDALAEALARNVYESSEIALARDLAEYVRRADKALEAQPQARFIGGVVQFPSAETP